MRERYDLKLLEKYRNAGTELKVTGQTLVELKGMGVQLQLSLIHI